MSTMPMFDHLPTIAPALYLTITVVLAVVAILLLIGTKGRLGYSGPDADEASSPPAGQFVPSQS